jgi:hypothetical protein
MREKTWTKWELKNQQTIRATARIRANGQIKKLSVKVKK